MSTEFPFWGGCLCGAILYRVKAQPIRVVHCHCSLCRRSSGAPFLTWVAFPAEAFAFTRGAPAVHKATPKAERAFCAACGTHLTFRHAESPRMIDVTVGSLNDPNVIRPDDHIWTSAQVTWLHLDDSLPRYRGERGEN
jgi:hypothetical protein